MWPWKNQELGDLFEEEVEKATQIKARVVFSGTERDMSRSSELPKLIADGQEPSDRQLFVIERKMGRGDAERMDQHIFVVNFKTTGETEVEWWWHQPAFHGRALFVSTVDSEKSSNELTRILSRHWDFNKLI
jgi:hypothetical protein